MRGRRHSTRNGSQVSPAPPNNSIAIDEDLLSLITSEEAVIVTPQISRIYFLLLGTIPVDEENSLPIAQEWLLQFDGEDQDGSRTSAWQQLRWAMAGVDDDELRGTVDWMQGRGIINT